jgi:hypothetical protein
LLSRRCLVFSFWLYDPVFVVVEILSSLLHTISNLPLHSNFSPSCLSACFQSQHMKHFQTSFIKHLRITSALSNQNCLEQISLLLIMLARYDLLVIIIASASEKMRHLMSIHLYCLKCAGAVPV